MASGVGGTIAGLEALVVRVHEATERSVARVAHILQAHAMANAPVGRPGNTTNPSGDLRRSIQVDGPHGADGTYEAKVGPTVTTVRPGPGGEVLNYGRIREFGGVIVPRVRPLLRFQIDGVWFSRHEVHQEGALYLTRAREDSEAELEAVIDVELTRAVEGD